MGMTKRFKKWIQHEVPTIEVINLTDNNFKFQLSRETKDFDAAVDWIDEQEKHFNANGFTAEATFSSDDKYIIISISKDDGR